MLTCQSLKKSTFLSAFLLMALFSFTSCGGNHEVDSKVATIINGRSPMLRRRDEKFLVRAAEINFEEIMPKRQQRTASDIKPWRRMKKLIALPIQELRAMAMSKKSLCLPLPPKRSWNMTN
jgi:hypothetical protein